MLRISLLARNEKLKETMRKVSSARQAPEGAKGIKARSEPGPRPRKGRKPKGWAGLRLII